MTEVAIVPIGGNESPHNTAAAPPPLLLLRSRIRRWIASRLPPPPPAPAAAAADAPSGPPRGEKPTDSAAAGSESGAAAAAAAMTASFPAAAVAVVTDAPLEVTLRRVCERKYMRDLDLDLSEQGDCDLLPIPVARVLWVSADVRHALRPYPPIPAPPPSPVIWI